MARGRWSFTWILLVLALTALLGHFWTPYDPLAPQPEIAFLPPSVQHLFGTDDLGRDVFSRVLAGTPYSLLTVAAVLSIAVTLGTLVGLVAGYAGGLVDEMLMRVTDIFLAFPVIILALALTATFGPSYGNSLLAIGLVWWPGYARLVRGQVLTLRERDYVEAAQALGAGTQRIIWRHILRNALTPVLVQLSLDTGNVLVTASALSFIGLGAQPPTPEWGLLVSLSAQNVLTAWWQSTFPGLAIFCAALALNAVGERLQSTLAPRRQSLI